MEQTKASSLIDMANGAIKERLDYEMGRVIQNISDPNTKATAKRTFQEVEQPESEFVFRVYDDRSISLTAADGGMWKLAARNAVYHYLGTALWDEITTGKVKVTL